MSDAWLIGMNYANNFLQLGQGPNCDVTTINAHCSFD